jgi:hypothetical protein
VLVAAAEAEEAEELSGLVLEVLVEASEADAVVESVEVEVEADASVPVLVPVEELVELELELELLLEQVTSVGRLVTPPRAQIDLATLRVAVTSKEISWVCSIGYFIGCSIEGFNHLLSWSALEHLSATQQETSFKKDLASQMHLKSMPHFAGMAPVAHSFCRGKTSQQTAHCFYHRYIPSNQADHPDLEQQQWSAELPG